MNIHLLVKEAHKTVIELSSFPLHAKVMDCLQNARINLSLHTMIGEMLHEIDERQA